MSVMSVDQEAVEQNNFMWAIQFVKKWEGGWSDHTNDPGGKTMWGISDAGDGTVDGLVDIDRNGKGDVPVKELTIEQALQIYKQFYWDAAGCNKLEKPTAVAVFDTAVNCGVGRARRWLRESKNLDDFLDKRRAHYVRLVKTNPEYNVFFKGWINRLNDLHKYVDILAKEM